MDLYYHLLGVLPVFHTMLWENSKAKCVYVCDCLVWLCVCMCETSTSTVSEILLPAWATAECLSNFSPFWFLMWILTEPVSAHLDALHWYHVIGQITE